MASIPQNTKMYYFIICWHMMMGSCISYLRNTESLKQCRSDVWANIDVSYIRHILSWFRAHLKPCIGTEWNLIKGECGLMSQRIALKVWLKSDLILLIYLSFCSKLLKVPLKKSHPVWWHLPVINITNLSCCLRFPIATEKSNIFFNLFKGICQCMFT